jgi:hypothetical protein
MVRMLTTEAVLLRRAASLRSRSTQERFAHCLEYEPSPHGYVTTKERGANLALPRRRNQVSITGASTRPAAVRFK